MKKLVFLLLLISLTTQAMQVDEEAALPTGQEQHQNEGEKVLQEKKKHFCIRMGERLKTCTQRPSSYMAVGLGTAFLLATGVMVYAAFS